MRSLHPGFSAFVSGTPISNSQCNETWESKGREEGLSWECSGKWGPCICKERSVLAMPVVRVSGECLHYKDAGSFGGTGFD